MKKVLFSLLALGLMGVLLLRERSASSGPQQRSVRSAKAQAAAVARPRSTSAMPLRAKALTPVQASERRKLIAQYRQALLALSQKVRELGLDDKALVEQLLAALPMKNARSVPTELAPELKSFHAAIEQLQEFDLTADRRTRKDIAPLKVYRPRWVEEREAELRRQEVPAPLASELLAMASASSLSDADIARVVELCAHARDCVENSVMKLIDANHLLTDEQLAYIKGRVN